MTSTNPRAMSCPCGETWATTDPVDAVMPTKCPACGNKTGRPDRVRVQVTIECPRTAMKGHSILGWVFKDKLQKFLAQDEIISVGAGYVAFEEEGPPEVESCGHDTAPKDPIECCYDTELGFDPPKLCRCCPECAHECYQNT